MAIEPCQPRAASTAPSSADARARARGTLTLVLPGKATGTRIVVMSAITLTSKRQATFPIQVCDDLNLRPGDIIELEPAELAGERVWVLRPQKPPQRPWLGCLAGKTAVANHSLDAVRSSIAAGRKKNST